MKCWLQWMYDEGVPTRVYMQWVTQLESWLVGHHMLVLLVERGMGKTVVGYMDFGETISGLREQMSNPCGLDDF